MSLLDAVFPGLSGFEHSVGFFPLTVRQFLPLHDNLVIQTGSSQASRPGGKRPASLGFHDQLPLPGGNLSNQFSSMGKR
jgi:hypothetical protein